MSRVDWTGKGCGIPKGQSLKEFALRAASEQKATLPQPPHLYSGHKPPCGGGGGRGGRKVSETEEGEALVSSYLHPTQGIVGWAEAGVRRQGCGDSVHREADLGS